ncbi:MAG TPA: hypothetical protein VIX41_11495 [Acidimicrobiales bacterium]
MPEPRIEPLSDSVREELDAWSEYHARVDAPMAAKLRWQRALDAVRDDPAALEQWRAIGGRQVV